MPVTSTEGSSPVEHHSAGDIQALTDTRTAFEPPAQKNERVKWPATVDGQWSQFEKCVMERLKAEKQFFLKQFELLMIYST